MFPKKNMGVYLKCLVGFTIAIILLVEVIHSKPSKMDKRESRAGVTINNGPISQIVGIKSFQHWSIHQNIDLLQTSGRKSSMMGPLNKERTKRDSGANQDHYIHKIPCESKRECNQIGTECDAGSRQCKCPRGYIYREMTGNWEPTDQFPTIACFRAAKIGDRCLSQAQCFVTNSVCVREDQADASKRNDTNFCRCKEHYQALDGFEEKDVNGLRRTSNTICRYYHHGPNSAVVAILVFFGFLTFVVIIICVIALIKMKANKGQMENGVSTVTSANSEPTEAINSSAGNNLLVSRDLSNLPPIGSAEAEFQNDFIPVFPMRQLEPLPEKNTTALNLQFSQE